MIEYKDVTVKQLKNLLRARGWPNDHPGDFNKRIAIATLRRQDAKAHRIAERRRAHESRQKMPRYTKSKPLNSRKEENARFTAATPHNTTAQIPLLNIPPEIRNHIWELALFGGDTTLIARADSVGLIVGGYAEPRTFTEPGLLQTCRQIRRS
ncbi:hypothetical protein Tdes44962_MAKER07113 [Teratosphaeria destructans]|uniref:Uncharacterized protein n=1 Tax=Teratosphaeria destructans TaxID=418781 RepID=A0A9W7T033_9PEZI|nr:hypothetical protein Tdes44962_MAKER07113 [Teratosphaeria destructans]